MTDFLTPRAHDPHVPGEAVRLESRVELASFRAGDPPPPQRLRVLAWNLERGLELDGQRAFLRDHPVAREADVLLLSEVDRGCSRTCGRHVGRELAEALRMDYAFGVQYVELPRRARRRTLQIDTVCEHGNAILSRWPLADVRRLQHTRTARWDDRVDEPRLGGCTSLRADVMVPGGPLRVYAVHFDSGLGDDAFRRAQAADLVADAADCAGPVLIGGDMNTFRFTLDVTLGTRWDPTPPVFLDAGYSDAHAGLPRWRRGTTSRRYGPRGVIDLIFARGRPVAAAGILHAAEGLSDHLPVWADLVW